MACECSGGHQCTSDVPCEVWWPGWVSSCHLEPATSGFGTPSSVFCDANLALKSFNAVVVNVRSE